MNMPMETAELLKQTGEVLIPGLTKGEFIACFSLGVIALGVVFSVMFVILLFIVHPMKVHQKEMASDIKKMLSTLKSDNEMKDMVKSSVLEHTIKCEGKKVIGQQLPQILSVLNLNSTVIQNSSTSSDKLATACDKLVMSNEHLSTVLHGLQYELERKEKAS